MERANAARGARIGPFSLRLLDGASDDGTLRNPAGEAPLRLAGLTGCSRTTALFVPSTSHNYTSQWIIAGTALCS